MPTESQLRIQDAIDLVALVEALTEVRTEMTRPNWFTICPSPTVQSYRSHPAGAALVDLLSKIGPAARMEIVALVSAVPGGEAAKTVSGFVGMPQADDLAIRMLAQHAALIPAALAELIESTPVSAGDGKTEAAKKRFVNAGRYLH